jgi:HopA1 effector protein family
MSMVFLLNRAILQPQQNTSIVQRLVTNLEKITLKIFGAVPDKGLRFHALHQLYLSLGIALAELNDAFNAACLTRNDLKTNNILLHNDWQYPESVIVAEANQQAKTGETVGETVTIKLPENRVQSGFYIAVEDEGFDHQQVAKVLVRIYFNLSPDSSVAVMESLTQGLNKIGIHFSFKVLYSSKDCNRYDLGVLYVDRQDYATATNVIRSFYDHN